MVIDEFEIRKDVIRIERFYQRRGYPKVEVSTNLKRIDTEQQKLVFLIKENKPLEINTLKLLQMPR